MRIEPRWRPPLSPERIDAAGPESVGWPRLPVSMLIAGPEGEVSLLRGAF